MQLPSIESADLKNKTVFVRGDIDVPYGPVIDKNHQTTTGILDDTRLQSIWPTIEYLLKQNCKIILAGHIGRPEGKEDLTYSSKLVALWFTNKVIAPNEVSDVILGNNIKGFAVNDKLTVLENLRFDPREEANDEIFARELADLAQIYINEAFAVCERAHTSLVGLPKLLPHYAGLRLLKEVEVFTTILDLPRRPIIVIIGGAKLETKLPVIANMSNYADRVIVGGKLLHEVGEKKGKILYLDLTPDGKDTTLESVDQCQIILSYAATIIWNGPLGKVEEYTYQLGSRRMAELMVNNTKAFKVVGGGDTITFLDKLGLKEKFDWISTGGGSMLKFLAGEELPGLKALEN